MHALARLVTALVCSTTVLAQCYFPNGDAVDSDTPCNPDALVSACCYKNQACLSNGLCVSDPHNPDLAAFHRGTCTDKQWLSGNCPRQCLDINNNGVPVFSCNSTSTDSYCCYDGCDCQAGSGSEIFTLAQSPADVYTLTIIGESFTQTHTSGTSSTPSSSATTSSASASASASNSASTAAATTGSSPISSTSATPTTPAAEPEKKSNATALGAGLGVGIPVAALLGLGIFFLLRRRRRNQAAESPPSELAADEYALDPTPPHMKYAHMAEAQATTQQPHVTHELSGGNEKRAELPADMPSTPGTAEGVRAMELQSPLNSPGAGARQV